MTNKIIGVVKIILREAVIREEFDRDPTEYVRNVRRVNVVQNSFARTNSYFVTVKTAPPVTK